MIISQSFKVKQPDGSFGDETMLSTTSDLVFYKDGKTLTTKTSETDAAIVKEVTDRENAIDSLRTELNGNIDSAKTELNNTIASTKTELQTSITANTNAINTINDSTNGILAQSKAYIDTQTEAAVASAESYTDSKVAGLSTELNDSISANTASITALQGDLGAVQNEVANLVGLIGESDVEPELTILERLVSIEERLTSIEDRLNVLETPTA